MRTGNGISYSMEALALVSALCIAAIFVAAHHQRQVDACDQLAARAARQVPAAVAAVFAAAPAGELTPEALAGQGFAPPAPLKWRVPPEQPTAGDWRVEVWHPEGGAVMVVTGDGIAPRPR